MKLTKDTLIEGQIVKKGTLIKIKEIYSEYRQKAKSFIDDWESRYGNDYQKISSLIRDNIVNSPYSQATNEEITAFWDELNSRY